MIKRTKKLVSTITYFLESHNKLMVALTMVTFFFRSLMSGLIKGGRWDLYQNIAMADRFLNGQGFYYSPLEASSPYFPGVAFLAILIGKICYPYRDYILLVMASLIGTVFLYALFKLGERFSKNREISLVVTFALSSIGFEHYRGYMNEFKADSFILLYAVLITLIIDKVENDERQAGVCTISALFILSFLMDVTKQQALYVDVALGIYLIITKSLEMKEKIVILGSLVAAGLVDLAVLFSIPGLEIHTIRNLSDMPYWDVRTIIWQMGTDVMKNKIYFMLLFSFIYLLIKKRIRLEALAGKWFAIAFAFGVGQIAGGWKRGGNNGNYEVGMIAFLPFVVVAFAYFYRKYFKDDKMRILTVAMNYAVCGMCFVMLALSGSKTGELVTKIQMDREVSAYLSREFSGETIMYQSNQYMQLARSTVNPGMDILAVPQFMKEYMHTIEEHLENQTYPYLYIRSNGIKAQDNLIRIYCGEEVDAQGMLEKYYEVIEDPDMPESLQGNLFKAK